MKKFKNIFIVAMLTLTMVLALAACGRVENPTVPSENETIEESIEETSQENNEETPTIDEGVTVGENDETTIEVVEGEEPGDSTQPIPGTPSQPSNPSNPTNPTQPSNPSNPTNPTNPTQPTTPAYEEPTTHVHNWVAITTVVHHDAITHEETVYKTVHHDAVYETIHHDAVTHEEPVYETHRQYVCNACGKGMYTDFNGDGKAFADHVNWECQSTCHTADYQVIVGYKTVVDKEAYDEQRLVKAAYDEQVPDGTRTVVDKAAWDETVVTGYRCSICGETK